MTNNNCLMRFSRPALQALAAMGIVLFLLPQISQAAQRGQGPPQPGSGIRIKTKARTTSMTSTASGCATLQPNTTNPSARNAATRDLHTATSALFHR